MRGHNIIALVGAVSSVVSGAAVLLGRQAPAAQPSTCYPTITVYVPYTVYDHPDTVTIALPDASSIAADLSTKASIDSQYISDESQLAPVSAKPDTSHHTFIITESAPAFEATEAPGGFYEPDYLAGTLAVPVSTTTVTVLPRPAGSPETAVHEVSGTITNTTIVTVQTTGGSGYGLHPYGYSNSTSSVPGYIDTQGVNSVVATTMTRIIATTTRSIDVNGTASSGNGTASENHPYGRDVIEPRQTCILISAERYGSWCNNWDGSTAQPHTHWDTTITPDVSEATDKTIAADATATSTVSLETNTPSPTPATCGESGPFQISFDQLPQWSPSTNDTSFSPPIWIDNPVNHFYWSADWTYAPPPNEPFPPQNGSHLAVYTPGLNNDTVLGPNNTNSGSRSPGSVPSGASFGAGINNANDNFWFSVKSAYAACDNNSTDPRYTCDFVATGFQSTNGIDHVVVTEHFTIPPCLNFVNCQLQQITFNSLFIELSAMSFYANVQGRVRTFYMDSLQLDWYNNTCAAGLARVNSR